MNEFEKLSRTLGFADLKSANRNKFNSAARQAISFHLKGKGFHENEIAVMQGRTRTAIIAQIKRFEMLLSVNDSLSVKHLNKIKDY